jgi:hypothetical protein
MTERHAGYVVTLKREIREDDAEAVIKAIELLAPVASVTPVRADANYHMAHERALREMREKIWEALK